MKKHEKIILEFTPEEIKLLAYGAIPGDVKKRLTRIAYYIDNEERVAAIPEQSKKKQPVEKKYNCELCSKPINHRGNCLKCNLTKKWEREKRITAKVLGSQDTLFNEILKIKSVDHKEIQLQLQSLFRNLGYFVELEKKIQAKRLGRIDLFAKKDSFSIGIEIDHSIIRWKSIDKLNTLRPNLAIYILKSRNINIKEVELRLNLIKTKAILVYLSNKNTRELN